MASASTTDQEMNLEDVLHEFNHVVEELKVNTRSSSCGSHHHLEGGRGTAPRDCRISGVKDSAYSSEASLGNSLNTSEEELHTAGVSLAPKAKLGDTGDLQSFIDSLDRELAEM